MISGDEMRAGPSEPEAHGHIGRRPRRALAGRLLLSYAIAATVVPISPLMPSLGLDAAWRLAINRAAVGGMHFGSQIVFTYGPLGAVLTRLYEPGLRALTLGAAVFLAAGCVTATLMALRWCGPAVHVGGAFAVIILSAYNLDALVLIYPLMAAFATTALPDRPFRRLVAIIIVFAPLGLLPIMKLSLTPAALIGACAAATLLLGRRDRAGAVIVLVAPVVSFAGWWALAGQPLDTVWTYFSATWPIVVGYSEAMSLHDRSRLAPGTVTGIYVGVAVITTALFLVRARRRREPLVLGTTTALILFVVFKAGYVRADVHMEVGALALLAVGALVVAHGGLSPTLGRVVGVGFVLASTLTYLATTVTSPVSDLSSYTTRPALDLVRGDLSPDTLRRRYDDALAEIDAAHPLPGGGGSSDLYTSALTLMFARGTVWSPRPVIQSYSAYTASLAMLNARHLEGPTAPRQIFFGIHPIDHRLAALEDGSSWVPLLQHYDLVGRSSGHLVLDRRIHPRQLTVGAQSLTVTPRLGQTVDLPTSTGAWLASFDVRPTRLGVLRTALWKPPQLRIEVRTSDGKSILRRFVPTMARAEFVLSPYIANTQDFADWFHGPSAPGGDRRVESIRVSLEDPQWPGASMSWRDSYTLRLRSLDLPH